MSAHGDEDGGERNEKLSEGRRFSRNLNEKKRRHRFNVLVDELARAVSPAKSSQKLEKTTILELVVKYLKENQVTKPVLQSQIASSGQPWQLSFLSDGEFSQILVEGMDGFIFALDSTGKVLHVSNSILPLLGVLPDKFLNSNILAYLHEEDQNTISTELTALRYFEMSPQNIATTGTSIFVCRMSGTSHSDNRTGCFKTVRCTSRVLSCTLDSANESPGPNSGSRMCLVVIGELISPQPNRTLFTATGISGEYTYRLTMDWKYISLDQHATVIIGFLPFEMLRKSAYDYIHPDDLKNIAQYHKVLAHSGRITTCYYRHITKGHAWIWLQSSCYVSYNQWNSKPECIVCTASIATNAEVCMNQEGILKNDQKIFDKVIAISDCSISVCPFDQHTARSSSVLNEHDQWREKLVLPYAEVNQLPNLTRVTSCDEELSVPQFLQGQAMNNAVGNDVLSMQSSQESHESVIQRQIQKQLKTHYKILQEQCQRISESIHQGERQLLCIRRLIEWNQELVNRYEQVSNVSCSTSN